MKNAFTKNYFFGFSLLVLIIGFLAFLDNMFFDPGQESNSNLLFIAHGLIMYCWIIVLLIQTNRVRKLNVKAHMAFGVTGFVIGLIMIITTAYVYFSIGVSWSETTFFGKANRIFLATFAIMYLFAYLKRENVLLHKHLIFAGLILILEPILSRSVNNLGGNPMAAVPLIWLGLWISLFVYDFMDRRKIYPVTYLGLIYWMVVFTVVS